MILKMILYKYFLIFQFLFLFQLVSCNCQNSTYQINLTEGIIEGHSITTSKNREGVVFLGIPYAKPPLGDLRFRKPEPPDSWQGILDCHEYKSACWQIHTAMDGINYTGIEDCLFLNVFAGRPCLDKTEKCPVLFYIHGGGYDVDTPSAFPPEVLVDNFASQNLIMVTIQFRLNAFGFWTVGTEEAGGNYGFYDMIASLQWTQRNIDRFGGDPSQVTIMGHSSGAVAVSLLTASPKTKGLFNRAIMMSGSSNTRPLENSLTFYWKIADELNCSSKMDPVQCMRQIPADLLGKTYLRLQKIYNFETSPRNDGPNGIFPQPLSQLMSHRRPIDSMIGTTKREQFYELTENETSVTSESIENLCEKIINKGPYRNKKSIIRECQRQYTRIENSTENEEYWTRRAENLMDDQKYHAPAFSEADSLRSQGSRIFLYSFDYSRSGHESTTPFHSFDLTYILGLHPFDFDDRDEKLQIFYSSLFVNFAKTGHPTDGSNSSSWTPLKSPYGFNFYSIDLPAGIMKTKYHFDGVIFWNYVVPAVENQYDPRNYFLNGKNQRLINDQSIFDKNRSIDQSIDTQTKNQTANDSAILITPNPESTDQSDSIQFWRKSFWITLSVLVVTVAVVAVFIVCGVRKILKKRDRRSQSQNLLFSNSGNYYQTF